MNCPKEVYINSNFECELELTIKNPKNSSDDLNRVEITYDNHNDDGTKRTQQLSFILTGDDVTSLRKLKFRTSGEFEFNAVSINNGLNVNPVVKSKETFTAFLLVYQRCQSARTDQNTDNCA